MKYNYEIVEFDKDCNIKAITKIKDFNYETVWETFEPKMPENERFGASLLRYRYKNGIRIYSCLDTYYI